jgi:hypothetical protein
MAAPLSSSLPRSAGTASFSFSLPRSSAGRWSRCCVSFSAVEATASCACLALPRGRAADHSCAHVVSSLVAGRGSVLVLGRRRVRHAREEEDEEVARGGRHGCRRRGSTRERHEEEGDFPLPTDVWAPQQQLTTGNGADGGMAHREWKIRNNDIELKLYFAMAHNTSLISYGIGGLVSLPLHGTRLAPISNHGAVGKLAHVSTFIQQNSVAG